MVGIITGKQAVVGKCLSLLAGTIKESKGKKAIEREIEEREPNPYVESSLIYSDMPLIHYSRKPAEYKNNPLSIPQFYST